MSFPAHAGLSLDELLARHRVLAGPQVPGLRSRLTPIAIEPDDASSVTAAIGGPGNDVPALLRPELRGEGGLSVRTSTTLAGGSVQARLGAAWWVDDTHPLSFDGSAISDFRLAKFLDIAALVMSRRSIELSERGRRQLSAAHAKSRGA